LPARQAHLAALQPARPGEDVQARLRARRHIRSRQAARSRRGDRPIIHYSTAVPGRLRSCPRLTRRVLRPHLGHHLLPRQDARLRRPAPRLMFGDAAGRSYGGNAPARLTASWQGPWRPLPSRTPSPACR
jgi:hypothetical protein